MVEGIWATSDPFIEGGEILGRKVANQSFLTALLRADPFAGYHFFLESREAADSQKRLLEEMFPDIAKRGGFVFFLHQELHRQLAKTRYEVFHLSDCLHRQVALARLRNVYSSHIFPITAPTHSLSYARFMPGYLAHLWPGACARDAIIATSASAVAMLERTFAGLEQAYGLDRNLFRRPRLERIPLGVDVASLPLPEERWDAGERGRAARTLRSRLGLGDETLFLCLARIAASSKMDCLPLITAFSRAFEQGLSPEKVCLVIAGWAEEGDALPESLSAYARARGLRLIPFLRPTDEERRALYAAADCFLSPSDNIQETFGLTLAEAGLSGLPVIASDFDGYRDIAAHGETGLLVPTLGCARSAETNLLAGLWYDNQYHFKLAQETAVDIPSLARAIERLTNDLPLRRKMGEAGRARCLDLFSWDAVIRRYLELWRAMAAAPLSGEEEARIRSATHPLAMDFAALFQGHFSATLEASAPETGEKFFHRTAMGDALYHGHTPPLRYAGHEYMLDPEALRRVLLAARKPATGAALLEAAQKGLEENLPAPVREERAACAVLWALKQGYIEEQPS